MSKICVYCGEDCSNKARIKDADGRYACKACADARAAGASKSDAAGSSAPARSKMPATAARAPKAVAAVEPAVEEGEVDLSALVAESESVGGQLQAMHICPNCQTSNKPAAKECLECAFNFVTRKAPARPRSNAPVGVSAREKCEKCGYSMKGLSTPKCPECGHVNTTDVRTVEHERDSRQSARAYWIKPIVIAAVALPIAAGAGIYDLTHKHDLEVGQAALVFAAMFAIYVVCSFGVYFLLGLFTGFSMAHSLAILGLIAVSAASSAAIAVFSAIIPLPLIPRIVNFFVYCGLASELLDIDLADSWKFGFLCAFTTAIGSAFILPPIIEAILA